MVPELARMAVIIKSEHKTSVMTGNYELAYACGFMLNLASADRIEWKNPRELLEKAMELLSGYAPESEQEKNVIHMLKYYHPDDTDDEQVRLLYDWGFTEKHPWTVIVKE